MFKFNQKLFVPKRLTFQNAGGEVAPKGPESMKGEQGDVRAEVAPMTPSQMVSNTWAVVTQVGGKYTSSTQGMAGLIKTAGQLPPLEKTAPQVHVEEEENKTTNNANQKN